MDFQEEIDKIKQIRREDPVRELRLVREFRKNLKLSRDIDEEKLQYYQAFSDTYLCEAYLMTGNIKAARETGLKALRTQLRGHYKDLLLSTYNLLGFIYGTMENYEGASSYFCSGIELAQKQNDYNMLRVLYINFGVAFLKLHEYEKAKRLFEQGWEMAQKANFTEEQLKIAEYEYHEELREYYLGVGAYDKVMDFVSEDDPKRQYMIARLAAKKGEKREAETAIGHFLQENMSGYTELEKFEINESLTEICLEIEHQYYTRVCLDRMYDSAKICDLSNQWVSYYGKQIRACELYGWEMRQENYYEAFYQYHQQAADQREENERASLVNELEIYQVKRKQNVLEKKTERLKLLSLQDDLTKVWNRAGFEIYMRELLERTKMEQIQLGVIIIDIDHFKEINDRFGHLTGDVALRVVAKILRSAFPEPSKVCRYGGDEFVIITAGMEMEDIHKALQKIAKNRKLKSAIMQETGQEQAITLSIGAVNCVPEVNSFDMDYLYTADKLLYDVKRESRNAYLLENKLQ